MGNAQFNEFQLQLPECVLLYQGNGQQAITEAQYMPVDLLGPPQMLEDIPMEGSFFLDYPGEGNANAFLKLVVFDPQPTELFVLPLDQPFSGQQTFQVNSPGIFNGNFAFVIEDFDGSIDDLLIDDLQLNPEQPLICEDIDPIFINLFPNPPAAPTPCMDYFGVILYLDVDGQPLYCPEGSTASVEDLLSGEYTAIEMEVATPDGNLTFIFLYGGDDCDDGDPCTHDFCDPITEMCQHVSIIEDYLDPPQAAPCMVHIGTIFMISGVYNSTYSTLPNDHEMGEDDTVDLILPDVECDLQIQHYFSPQKCLSSDPCEIGTCNPATGECEYVPSQLNFGYDVVRPTCGPNGEISCTISGGVPPYSSSLKFEEAGQFNVHVQHYFVNGVGNYDGVKSGNYRMTITDSQGCEVVKDIEVEDKGLKVYPGKQDAVCIYDNNGSITARVEFGTPGYTATLLIQWPSGQYGGATAPDTSAPHANGMDYGWNNLYPGNYKIVVVDAAGCTIENTMVIGSFPAVSAQVTVIQPACPGDLGEIQIIASGGQGGPYNYTLNGGFATNPMGNGISIPDVMSGNYQIFVQGTAYCVSPTVNVALFPVPNWNVGAVSTEETCNGDNDGTITITAAGANGGPYTYSVDGGAYGANNTIGGLSDGIHTYTVKDVNGCVSPQGQIAVVGYGLLGAVKNTTGASCYYSSDGSAEISGVQGKAPYLYSFDGGTHVGGEPYLVTDLSGGSYASMVIDANGCSYMFSTSINSPDTLGVDTLSVLPSTNGLNGAIDIDVLGGVPGYTYQWSNGDTIQDISMLPPLDYFVTVTDTIGCIDTLTVNVPGVPNSIDTDGDGISDYNEEFVYETDPLNSDTDGDLVNDGEEINDHGTDPLNADTDGDGELDGVEILLLFTDPLVGEEHEELEFGCTYSEAINFSTTAQVDDNSCVFDTDETTCAADLSGDGAINMADLLLMLGSFGGSCGE